MGDHRAFVLAAGLGTRLAPFTRLLPKPLVPVCGVSLLDQALAACVRSGRRRVVVNAFWLHERIERWAAAQTEAQVTVLVEANLLGTGGGLRNARALLAERVVVLNADVLHRAPLDALEAAVPPGGAALSLRPDPAAARYGVVAADAEGRVVDLAGLARTEAVGAAPRDTFFTGLHALDRAVLDRVPDGPACIVRSAYVHLVPERRLAAIRDEGGWIDAGDPEAYLAANLAVLEGLFQPCLPVFPRAGFAVDGAGRAYGDPELVRGARIEGPVWVGPGARLSPGVRLERAVVGARAHLAPGVALRGSVVWDDVDLRQSLEGGVAYDPEAPPWVSNPPSAAGAADVC
jgi:NDP-sugar pyrophosphorylase family protein